MSNDLIIDGELQEEAQPEVEAEEQVEAQPEPKSRYDEWDRDTAIKNYQELEKLNSRQAQEVGQYRKQIDQFLMQQQQPPKEETIDLDAFLEDPNSAVHRSVMDSPELNHIKTELQTIKQKTAVSELKAKHPDFIDVYQDPAFQNWATENPIRARILEQANNYDVDAADYIFSEWKSQASQSQQQAEESARLEKARSDMGKAASESASGPTAKKTYSRLELARLKTSDPEKYNALWDDIYQAYQEGRVR